MVQYRTVYSSGGHGNKEPQADAISVWSGAEPENIGDGRVTKGERGMGEYWLWKSVIAQALQDVASCSNDRKIKSARAEAIAWFSLTNESFLWVCELAGECPHKVMERAKEVVMDSKIESNKLRHKLSNKKRWKWLGSAKHVLSEQNEMMPANKLSKVR